MALMLSQTYDALVDAGASPDKAQAGAEEVASLHDRLTRFEITLGALLVIQIPVMIVFLATLDGRNRIAFGHMPRSVEWRGAEE